MELPVSQDDRACLAAPFFSIIMPCFNSQEYLKESVRSVLNQSDKDFEVIIVDDGSTDESEAIVEKLVSEDDRIRFLKNDHAPGASGARNCGAYVSQGKWICFLDSDDLFLKNCLSIRKAVIQENPDIRFFSSDFFRWIDSETDKIRQSEQNEHWKSIFSGCEGSAVIRINDALDLFLKGVVAWTGGVTLHRELFMALGGFNETLKRAEDHHLWFRCAALSGKLGLIRNADSIYRIRSSGLSGGINRITSYNISMYKLMKKDRLFAHVADELDKKIDNHHYMLGVQARGNEQWCRAINHSFLYWLRNPVQRKRIKNLVASLLFRS